MRALIVSLILIWSICPGLAFSDDSNVRFAAVDIYLKSAEPIAAWQFELNNRHGLMKVVGVERGESAAYARVPYYDRESVRLGEADRIVVADYSLADDAELPSGRTRVATVHLMLSGDDDTDLNLFLITATKYDGRATGASISFEVRTGSEQ